MDNISLAALWEQLQALAPIYLFRLAIGVVVFLLFWLAGSALRRAVHRFFAVRQGNLDLALFLGGAVKIVALTLGAVTALGTLGLDVTALVAGLGLLGFAVGFALKDIISNALAGVLILLYKPYERNDLITVASVQGVVVEINLRYTVLSAEGSRILIPNANVFTNTITVATKP